MGWRSRPGSKLGLMVDDMYYDCKGLCEALRCRRVDSTLVAWMPVPISLEKWLGPTFSLPCAQAERTSQMYCMELRRRSSGAAERSIYVCIDEKTTKHGDSGVGMDGSRSGIPSTSRAGFTICFLELKEDPEPLSPLTRLILLCIRAISFSPCQV